MGSEKREQFNAGYVIACANLVNLHGEPGCAADMMAQLGITWGEVERMDLSDYDMRALQLIKQEKSRHPFLDGRAALGGKEG